MRCVGLDLSLSSTGIATSHDSHRIRTSEDWPMLRRLRVIRRGVETACRGADAIVVEGPSFGSRFGKSHERAGCWWLVVERLEAVTTAGIAVIPPKSLKVFAVGNGNAEKAEVVRAARYHFGDRIQGDDTADATFCAAAGYAALGEPLVQLPPEHTRGLASLVWLRPCDLASVRFRDAARALGGAR